MGLGGLQCMKTFFGNRSRSLKENKFDPTTTQCLKITKKSHSTLRAKRATFTFWVDKSSSKMPKLVNFGSVWKPEACGQTVLPDRSLLMRQKLMENAKIQMRHFGWFSNTVQQTEFDVCDQR